MSYQSKVAPKIVSTSLIFACLPVQAATYYVNGNVAPANCTTADGTAAKPFCTIQAAVNKAAASGDTVQVAAGNYDPVDINNKSLKLLGANPTITAIQGYDYGVKVWGFSSAAPGRVEITNFTIMDASGAGISVNPYSNVNVHHCVLGNNKYGIYVYGGGSNASVTNSIIILNDSGVSSVNYYGYARVTSSIIMYNGRGIENQSFNPLASSYNTYFENTTNRYGGGITTTSDKDNIDPLLNADSTLQAGSPAIDAGSPLSSERDPDGSRNDQGIYGGPGAAVFMYPNLPTVTNLFITPSAVNSGGTFSIQATGQAQ